jgi:hypothetical protein
MATKINYNGKEIAVVKDDEIVFHDKDADINDLLVESFGGVTVVERDDGTITYEQATPSLDAKIIMLQKLGFEIVVDDKVEEKTYESDLEKELITNIDEQSAKILEALNGVTK